MAQTFFRHHGTLGWLCGSFIGSRFNLTRSPPWTITKKNCWSTMRLNWIRWIRSMTPPSCKAGGFFLGEMPVAAAKLAGRLAAPAFECALKSLG